MINFSQPLHVNVVAVDPDAHWVSVGRSLVGEQIGPMLVAKIDALLHELQRELDSGLERTQDRMLGHRLLNEYRQQVVGVMDRAAARARALAEVDRMYPP